MIPMFHSYSRPNVFHSDERVIYRHRGGVCTTIISSLAKCVVSECSATVLSSLIFFHGSFLRLGRCFHFLLLFYFYRFSSSFFLFLTSFLRHFAVDFNYTRLAWLSTHIYRYLLHARARRVFSL